MRRKLLLSTITCLLFGINCASAADEKLFHQRLKIESKARVKALHHNGRVLYQIQQIKRQSEAQEMNVTLPEGLKEAYVYTKSSMAHIRGEDHEPLNLGTVKVEHDVDKVMNIVDIDSDISAHFGKVQVGTVKVKSGADVDKVHNIVIMKGNTRVR